MARPSALLWGWQRNSMSSQCYSFVQLGSRWIYFAFISTFFSDLILFRCTFVTILFLPEKRQIANRWSVRMPCSNWLVGKAWIVMAQICARFHAEQSHFCFPHCSGNTANPHFSVMLSMTCFMRNVSYKCITVMAIYRGSWHDTAEVSLMPWRHHQPNFD